jgi:beta-carotene hydroxylase
MTHAVPAATRPRIPRDALYQPPAIAWPTLGLFMLALLLWVGALLAAVNGIIPPLVAIALQSFAAFMQFTVLHDGVHRSLMRGYPRANDFIAGVAGAALGPIGTCAAFRHVHFAHHRHTNEVGSDPDLWSGLGRRWLMPLHWATADFYYAVRVLRDWSSIAVRDRVQIVGYTGTLTALYALAWWAGYGIEATLYWLIPSRLAIFWLAFAFNYLPHHPHAVEQRHNPYAATNVRKGGGAAMTGLFLYQNFHLIHHLFPSVPFYRYARIWRQQGDEFKRQGAPEVPWYALEPRAER